MLTSSVLYGYCKTSIQAITLPSLTCCPALCPSPRTFFYTFLHSNAYVQGGRYALAVCLPLVTEINVLMLKISLDH